MIVVADASPLNFLVLIEQIHLLRILFDRVLIPKVVLSELQRPRTPPPVSLWIANLPAWLEVCVVHRVPDADLDALDPGERDAILLALERRADAVLIDEAEGRRAAENRNLRVVSPHLF